MAKKGVEFQTETMMRLAFVLLVFFAIVIILTNIGGGIQSIIAQFCRGNPQLCGAQTPSTLNKEVALKSTRALVCAIDSVLAKKEQSCIEDFNPAQTKTFGLVSAQEETTKTTNVRCYNDPKGCENACNKECTETAGCIKAVLNQGSCKETIISHGQGNSYNDCTCTLTLSTSPSITCNQDTSSCEVKNFNLPEDFGNGGFKPREYIDGFGDPSFLVYYQSFPPGEEADWSSQSAWFSGTGKIMFATMCGGHVLGPLIKGTRATFSVTKNLVKNHISIIVTKLGGSIDSKVLDEAAEIGAKSIPTTTTKIVGKEVLEAVEKGIMNKGLIEHTKLVLVREGKPQTFDTAWEIVSGAAETGGKIKKGTSEYFALRNEFRRVWDGEFSEADLSVLFTAKAAEETFLKTLSTEARQRALSAGIRAAEYSALDYGISYFIAKTDSEIGKFVETHSNSIVLGEPLREETPILLYSNQITAAANVVDPTTDNLVEVGKPVILDKESFFNSPTPFYLASPCQADVTVEPEIVICGAYSYDNVGGQQLATCDTPDDPSWYDVFKDTKYSCSALPSNVDNEGKKFMDKEAELIRDITKAEVYGGEIVIPGTNEKRIKIVDKMHDLEMYFNKDQNIIDYIGVTGKAFYGATIASVESLNKDKENQPYFTDETKSRGIVINSYTPKGFPCVVQKGDRLVDDEKEYLVCLLSNIIQERGTVYLTDIRVYFELDNKNFFALSVSKSGGVGGYVGVTDVVFKDLNGDGKIDEIDHYFQPDLESDAKQQARVFQDKDFNGKIDVMTARNCKIEAIKVIPKKKGEDENGNNYCFKSKSAAWTISSTVATFGVSGLAKTVGGFPGWMLATAVDCGIATAELSGAGVTNWPKG